MQIIHFKLLDKAVALDLCLGQQLFCLINFCIKCLLDALMSYVIGLPFNRLVSYWIRQSVAGVLN